MNAKWMIVGVLLGALVAVGSFAQPPQKQPLQYHTSSRPHPLVGGLTPASLQSNSEPPEGLKLPDVKGADPIFARWASPLLPEGFLWIVLGCSDKEGVYDRLLLDANANGRLDDESPVAASSASSYASRFGPVKVLLNPDGQSLTYHLNFALTKHEEPPQLSVIPGGWYEGTITVDGKKKRCVVIDQDANGTFNDRSLDFDGADLIQIGEEGDLNICLVGHFIQVDDEPYRLEVGRSGTYVVLVPAKDVRWGSIRAQEEVTQVEAGGENGMLTVKLEKGIGRLPVGKYRVYGWAIEREDENGSLWTAKATSFGNPDAFEIRDGQETSLDVGEPIVSSVEIWRNGVQCTVRHSWRGRAGERIQLMRNELPPPPAQVHLWNADESYDREFTFAHG